MKIMWKDRSNSLSPRQSWRDISKTRAEKYLRNHYKGEDYEVAVLRLSLGQVVETVTFIMKV